MNCLRNVPFVPGCVFRLSMFVTTLTSEGSGVWARKRKVQSAEGAQAATLWAAGQSLLLLCNQNGKSHNVPPWILTESYFRNDTELCLDPLQKRISLILSGLSLWMRQMWACILLNAFSVCWLGTWCAQHYWGQWPSAAVVGFSLVLTGAGLAL